jgi:hypothetical protein
MNFVILKGSVFYGNLTVAYEDILYGVQIIHRLYKPMHYDSLINGLTI